MSAPATTTATVIHDERTLLALGPAWDALEARALALGQPARLFESHRYVRLAWQHLRAPGDRLNVVALGDAHGLLRAVWPLVRRRERAMGLPIDVLRPIGIWQGERPGVLCDAPDAAATDAIWATLWQALLDGRADWQMLHLRELDAGSWPLRHLADADAAAAAGLRVQVEPDHVAPWQPLGGPPAGRLPGAATGPDRVAASPDWPTHVGRRPAAVREALALQQAELSRHAPGAKRHVAETPEAVDAAFTRYLAVEAAAGDDPGVHRLGSDSARLAYYRDFLAELALRGEARIETLEVDGVDLAATLRLRCGGVWHERAAVERAEWRAAAPALALLLAGLADGQMKGQPTRMHESDLLLPPDATGRYEAACAWYDARRATSQLQLWNLRSRMVLVALARRLLGR